MSFVARMEGEYAIVVSNQKITPKTVQISIIYNLVPKLYEEMSAHGYDVKLAK